jgi:hypothetical protein
MTDTFPGGSDSVGSGKFDTPCARMHSANLTIASWRLFDGFGGVLLSGCNLSHVVDADLNAGDPGLSWGLLPLPWPGSGKFGTP